MNPSRYGRGWKGWREPAPATPEADLAGLWRVTPLYGVGAEPRWACLAALADLRVRPLAFAHLLLAVPEEVLRRAGTIAAQLLRGVGR